MAEKLKSVLGPIRWSLLLKAFFFSGLWWFVPTFFWFFAALYLYFSPPYQFQRFLPLFAALLILGAWGPQALWFAFSLGALFYLLLGLKNLIFIERQSVYENLSLLILFLLFWQFFSAFSGLVLGWGLPLLFLLALLIFWLFFDLVISHSPHLSSGHVILLSGVCAFLLFGFSLLLAFLPLSPALQALLLTFHAFFLLELFRTYAETSLKRGVILKQSSLLFIVWVVVLIVSPWGL